MNVRVEPAFYEALEAAARQDRRSVPQAARCLIEEGLRGRLNRPAPIDDIRARDVAQLASGAGAFAWLAEEAELYDDGSGEPA